MSDNVLTVPYVLTDTITEMKQDIYIHKIKPGGNFMFSALINLVFTDLRSSI